MQPADLDAAARRLGAAARTVENGAVRLRAAGTTLRWEGPAAQAFRARLGDDVARVRAAARELDEAAAAVRAHAATVRHRQAQLEALAEAAAEVGGELVDDAVGLLGRLP